MIKGEITIKVRKYFNLNIMKMHSIIRNLKKAAKAVPLDIRHS